MRASFVTQNAQRTKQKRKIITHIAKRSVNKKEIGLKVECDVKPHLVL